MSGASNNERRKVNLSMITKIFLASLIIFTSSFWGTGFVIDKNIIPVESGNSQSEQRIISPYKNSTSLGVDIDGKSAMVVDYSSGRVLFEKNSQSNMPMASLTKVMTAVILLDSDVPLEDTYVIEPEVNKIYGSGINLEAGEEVRVSDLLHGLLINSGNDAAVAIARKVAKEEKKFVSLMNKKADELSMENTKFQNPHGLDQENHYSSASDLAKLALYAYKNETFRQLIKMKDYQFDAVNMPKHHQFKNTNKLLQEDYFLINGGKTGFTDNAGYCLITFGVDDNKHEIITVVLGEKEDGRQFHDTKAMIEWTFGNYNWD